MWLVWEKQERVSLVLDRHPLGRPRKRWKDNIKMDRIFIGCEYCTSWISYLGPNMMTLNFCLCVS